MAISLDDLSPELKGLLDGRLEGLGQFAQLLQRAAEQPKALAHFIGCSEALEESLPSRLVQAIALSVAADAQNGYLVGQHEQVPLERGLEDEEVRRLLAGQAMSCATLAPEEVAAATLARCLASECGRGCDGALLRLRRLVGEPASVACLMLAASHLALAAMANAWHLTAASNSPPQEDSS